MGKEWSFRSPGRAVDPLKLLQELFCKTGIFRIGPVSEPWEIYPVFPENLSAVPAHEDDPVGQIDRFVHAVGDKEDRFLMLFPDV